MKSPLRSAFFLLLLLSACESTEGAPPKSAPAGVRSTHTAPAAPVEPPLDDGPPALRLPTDVRPFAETLELRIDPKGERFSGAVDIDVELTRSRSVLWLHGRDLHVTRALVIPLDGSPIAATWSPAGDSGLAALKPAAPIPARKARVHIEYDAPFGNGQKGLYKTSEAGAPYAFTQFEATAARMAFPCFDEPGFKIPYTTTLVVPSDAQAIANTKEVSRALEGASVRVGFAPTLPLPSYLVAFAVGPLDITSETIAPASGVRSTPLSIRGVAPRGRGKEMAYAVAHTGEILGVLEKYTGIAYPYDKLDILAVPGKGGAMENAGAVTFGERLVLMDERTAPVGQKRLYAYVMAHELAHQWTGDLVTMKWWDDTWLNEAFATWLGNKTADLWNPEVHAGMSFLNGVQGAMVADALVNARAIRQPITSPHDIENAFDSITYQKGGGVLAMFERWAGPEVWQKGLHDYLEGHRFGNGTADDFLDAENAATGKDVKTAFHTFLDQPGVPVVEVRVSCSRDGVSAHLKQSRYLPLGSTGDSSRTWQLPICLRADGLGSPACTLLIQSEGDVALGTKQCPSWVFPNADAAGYFRFALARDDLAKLRTNGLTALDTREKASFAASLYAAYARGAMSFQEVLGAVAPLAGDADPTVAAAPMGYLTQARDWLFVENSASPASPERGREVNARARIEAYGRELYGGPAHALTWEAKKGESDEARTLRARVLGFLATTARDPGVRAEAKRRGLAYIKDGVVHEDAVDPNLAPVALAVVGEEADSKTWDAMKNLFTQSVDETVRGRLLYALSSAKGPELASAARELVLDPALRDNEILSPLSVALGDPEKRDVTWAWMKDHFDAIRDRLPRHHGGVALVGAGGVYCDEAHAQDLETFFTPKIDEIEGGPRVLASTLEDVRLCAARRKAQEDNARAFFTHSTRRP